MDNGRKCAKQNVRKPEKAKTVNKVIDTSRVVGRRTLYNRLYKLINFIIK